MTCGGARVVPGSSPVKISIICQRSHSNVTCVIVHLWVADVSWRQLRACVRTNSHRAMRPNGRNGARKDTKVIPEAGIVKNCVADGYVRALPMALGSSEVAVSATREQWIECFRMDLDGL